MKEKMIVGEREISAPGAIMKVIVLELSPEAKQMLTVKPPMTIFDRIDAGEFRSPRGKYSKEFREALEKEFLDSSGWSQELRDKIYEKAKCSSRQGTYKDFVDEYSELVELARLARKN